MRIISAPGRHECEVPSLAFSPTGTLYQCRRCRRWWFRSLDGLWLRVRWYHFRLNHRIHKNGAA